MPKNIVFCADGTWNHPNSSVMVSELDTNVYKLYKSLPVTATQVTLYDDGVGCDCQPIESLLGGAFGDGLFQKIKDGYTFISQVHEQGDQIYIFGFSRGAYTARGLAGMIAICGLPTQNFNQPLVETAFEAYRNKNQREILLATLASNNFIKPKIAFLGVWDTVGELGIPSMYFSDIDQLVYGFLDTGLHADVQAAFHALSIDERRSEFQPTLWTSTPAPGQIMKQVWFASDHSDVGGGHAEAGLSDITLSWMLNNAINYGIEVLPNAVARYQTISPKQALDPIHDSWDIIWGTPQHRTVPVNSIISNSVTIRISANPLYRPSNLTLNASGQLEGYSYESAV